MNHHDDCSRSTSAQDEAQLETRQSSKRWKAERGASRRGAGDVAGVRRDLRFEQGNPQGGDLSHGTTWPRA